MPAPDQFPPLNSPKNKAELLLTWVRDHDLQTGIGTILALAWQYFEALGVPVEGDEFREVFQQVLWGSFEKSRADRGLLPLNGCHNLEGALRSPLLQNTLPKDLSVVSTEEDLIIGLTTGLVRAVFQYRGKMGKAAEGEKISGSASAYDPNDPTFKSAEYFQAFEVMKETLQQLCDKGKKE